MKNFINKKKIYLITLLMSVFILFILFVNNRLAPFGSNTIVYSDLMSQYEMFLYELVIRITSGKSLIYSFSSGLGFSFFATIVNYLMSPINIIALIFKDNNIHKVMNLIVFVKPVLASLTMCVFLKNKFKTDKWFISIMSILYAFCGFFTAYYFNIMWIEAFILLPLVVLGLEKLINKKDTTLYVISLLLILLTNYYEAYMVCIFLVLYFLSYAYYNKKLKKDTVIRFIKYSVFSALLGMFILLPMFMILKSTSSLSSSLVMDNYKYPFSIIDFISAHFTGSYATRYSTVYRGVTDIATNSPNVTIGILGLALSILFIFNKEIDKSIKKTYLPLLCFFILCFFIPYLDVAMHAFKIPNDLPFRYSYMYSFLLIIISTYSFINLDKMPNINKIIVLISILILSIVLIIINPLNIRRIIIVANIVLLLFYAVSYYLCGIKEVRIAGVLLFIFFAMFECVLNLSINTIVKTPDKLYDYGHLKTNIELLEIVEHTPFYRLDSKVAPANSGSVLGYNGISTYNSVSNYNVAYLNRKLGLDGNGSYYFTYNGATPLYNILFDVKYSIGKQDDLFFNKIGDVYQFRNNKSLMFEVSKNILNWDLSSDNPFIVQNDLAKKVSNIDDLFVKEEVKEVSKISDNYYKYKINTSNKYIYLLTSSNVLFIKNNNTLYYRDSHIYNKDNSLTIVKAKDIKYDAKYEISNSKIVEIELDDSKEFEIYFIDDSKKGIDAYKMDYNKYNTFQKSIDSVIDISGFTDTEILGSIELYKDNSIIYTSIPYDEGWHVYIDGSEVKKLKIADSLIGIEATKGYHIVYLKYEVPYLAEGSIITSVTIILYVLNKYYDLLFEKDNLEDEEDNK